MFLLIGYLYSATLAHGETFINEKFATIGQCESARKSIIEKDFLEVGIDDPNVVKILSAKKRNEKSLKCVKIGDLK